MSYYNSSEFVLKTNLSKKHKNLYSYYLPEEKQVA